MAATLKPFIWQYFQQIIGSIRVRCIGLREGFSSIENPWIFYLSPGKRIVGIRMRMDIYCLMLLNI